MRWNTCCRRNGPNLARFLVGSEGTLTTTMEAVVSLGDVPNHRPSWPWATRTCSSPPTRSPRVLPHGPLAVEGIDSRLMDMVRAHKGKDAVPELPAGSGWLLIEVAEPDRRRGCCERPGHRRRFGHRFLPDHSPGPGPRLCGASADGRGLAGRTGEGRPGLDRMGRCRGSPDVLGDYLREQDELMNSYGFVGLPYGHFRRRVRAHAHELPLRPAGGHRDLPQLSSWTPSPGPKFGGSASGETR
ncbi:hypothetical protein [Brevibacterium sp. UCMA 11754]|uniref:hypothetical protein n=1 Tax=Brevibacterium sp. UCMA 11754 TaxID=2749198 RepID=UPI002E223D04|nr:hypothetical protein [Brevibacterium sp. UCMA 11754]